ncbi:HD-GYP domain-containing protein, partial [Vibrio rotiferianus]
QKLLNQTFEGKVIEVDEIESWADDMIESVFIDSDALQCVSALRQKDTYLLEHSVNVACLLVTFGKHLGLNKETLKQLAIGGIIHDVGKIKVDDAVLHKPARLTPEEFEHMKLHQVFAGEIILGVKGLSDVSRDVCLMHHEKLDGNGYPRGLSGDQIPMHGRMSCIVDIYDALTADRVYKKGMSSAEAFKILLSLTPSHLDPDLVYKFINCIGVYPVGSIVQLSDGRVGIVWTSNESQPLKPIVKCFYSRKYKRYIDVAMVDLKNSPHSVEKAVAPSSLEVDPKPFYD